MTQRLTVWMTWLSSVGASWISTPYLCMDSESCSRRSSRPALGCIRPHSLRIWSPSPGIDGSSAIRSCTHRPFGTGWSRIDRGSNVVNSWAASLCVHPTTPAPPGSTGDQPGPWRGTRVVVFM